MNTSSNAIQLSNREFFQQREASALRRIPGARELTNAREDQRPAIAQKYPEAAFALHILSNPFIPDRELGAIQMEAYSAILNGAPIAAVQFNYNRQMDAYMIQNNWD